MADFKKALNQLLVNEGLYSNDKVDAGGETYKGISRNNFPKWEGWSIIDDAKKKPGFPGNLEADFKLQALVGNFYKQVFWNKIGGEYIDNSEVASSIFDFAVNAGSGTCIKIVQEIIGVQVDGVMGVNSLEKLNATSVILFKYAFAYYKVKRYIAICNKRPENKKYFFGWISRAVGFILIAIAFNSCVTYNKCVEKFGQYPTDTVFVRVEIPVPVIVKVPSDSIQGSFLPDTLFNDMLYSIDSSNMLIQYWKEKYSNQINIKAKYKGSVIRDTVYIKPDIPCPPTPVLVEKLSKFKTWLLKYKTFASYALPIVIIFLLFGLFRRR